MAPSSHFPHNTILITGGGGGIGKALAAHFVKQGKKVLLAGRTESKLQEATNELGATGYYVLDTGDVASIPDFIARVTKDHPDLDCLVNNAGVQRPLQILQDDPGDLLGRADQEIDINIRGPMHLAVGLLPHLRALDKPAAIVNVSSVLGFLPFSRINPVYNGTKAWLHFWSMNLRSQIEAESGVHSRIRVIEIVPPTVETDLHREREDPDDNKKSKNSEAMGLDEFLGELAKGLEKGDDVIAPEPAGKIVERWYEAFGEMYGEMLK